MKNQLQIIIIAILIVALAGIVYVLLTHAQQAQRESNAKALQPDQTQSSASEATFTNTSQHDSLRRSNSSQPISGVKTSSNSVIKMQHCGANEYSVDCHNPTYPLIWFMYTSDPRPHIDQIISIEFMKANHFKDLWIDDLKVPTKDGRSCEVLTWGPDGENLTDEGLSIILDHCPTKQIKYVELNIAGKLYRFT
jgi:hypothetical protein